MVLVLMSALAIYIYDYGQADHDAPADVIIVLGGGVNLDNTLTSAQQRRVAHAVTLYQRGLARLLLCTGGIDPGRGISEAQTCVDSLNAAGVPLTAILREDISLSTITNAIEARRVMQTHELHTAIVVSDNFHLFRAEWLFHYFGVTVVMSPAQATQGVLNTYEALRSTFREVLALPLSILEASAQR